MMRVFACHRSRTRVPKIRTYAIWMMGVKTLESVRPIKRHIGILAFWILWSFPSFASVWKTWWWSWTVVKTVSPGFPWTPCLRASRILNTWNIMCVCLHSVTSVMLCFFLPSALMPKSALFSFIIYAIAYIFWKFGTVFVVHCSVMNKSPP